MDNKERISLEQLKAKVENLENEVQHLQTILDHIPGHVYWKGRNNHYLGCNIEQAIALGLSSPDEIKGKTVHDFETDNRRQQAEYITNPDDIDRIDTEVMNAGEPVVVEEYAQKIDGSKGVYLSKKIPFHDETGKVTALIGITQDISEIKDVQIRFEKINKLLKSVISANDKLLRSPVGNIMGLAEVLINNASLDSATRKRYTQDILDSSKKILPMLSYFSVLLNAIERKDDSISKEVFDLNETLIQLLNHASPQLHEITYQQNATLPYTLIGDVSLLDDIIERLITFIAQESSTKTCQVSCDVNTSHEYVSSIKLIFTSDITQLKNVKKDQVLNVSEDIENNLILEQSLELTVIKNLIENLNGTFDYVYSDDSTEFNIDLKFLIDNEKLKDDILSTMFENKEKHDISIDNSAINTKKIFNILVMDDDRVCCTAIAAQLSYLTNANITIVHSYNESKKLVSENHYDYVFVDMGLPDGNGFELPVDCAKELKNSVVVAITATTDELVHENALENGCAQVIVKPVSLANLRELFSQK